MMNNSVSEPQTTVLNSTFRKSTVTSYTSIAFETLWNTTTMSSRTIFASQSMKMENFLTSKLPRKIGRNKFIVALSVPYSTATGSAAILKLLTSRGAKSTVRASIAMSYSTYIVQNSTLTEHEFPTSKNETNLITASHFFFESKAFKNRVRLSSKKQLSSFKLHHFSSKRVEQVSLNNVRQVTIRIKNSVSFSHKISDVETTAPSFAYTQQQFQRSQKEERNPETFRTVTNSREIIPINFNMKLNVSIPQAMQQTDSVLKYITTANQPEFDSDTSLYSTSKANTFPRSMVKTLKLALQTSPMLSVTSDGIVDFPPNATSNLPFKSMPISQAILPGLVDSSVAQAGNTSAAVLKTFPNANFYSAIKSLKPGKSQKAVLIDNQSSQTDLNLFSSSLKAIPYRKTSLPDHVTSLLRTYDVITMDDVITTKHIDSATNTRLWDRKIKLKDMDNATTSTATGRIIKLSTSTVQPEVNTFRLRSVKPRTHVQKQLDQGAQISTAKETFMSKLQNKKTKSISAEVIQHSVSRPVQPSTRFKNVYTPSLEPGIPSIFPAAKAKSSDTEYPATKPMFSDFFQHLQSTPYSKDKTIALAVDTPDVTNVQSDPQDAADHTQPAKLMTPDNMKPATIDRPGCHRPPQLLNGRAMFRNDGPDLVGSFLCDRQYWLHGNYEIRCYNDTWDGDVPECIGGER